MRSTRPALDQADDGPGEIVVDHDGRILQVLALAEHVGRNKDAQLLGGGDLVAFLVADGTETPGQGRRGVRLAGDSGNSVHAALLELTGKILDRVGELCEDNHLFMGMRLFHEFEKGLEFGVVAGIPGTTLLLDVVENAWHGANALSRQLRLG